MLAGGNIQHQPVQVGAGLVQRALTIRDHTGVEVNPSLFPGSQLAVGGNLPRRGRCAERRAAAGAEQYHVGTGCRQCGGTDQIVAGAVQHVQTLGGDRLAVVDDIHDRRRAALLHAAAGFILQCGDAALLVARAGVVVDDLIVADEIFLEAVDHLDGLLEHLLILAAVHQEALSAEHLGNLGQHGGAAAGAQHIAEAADGRVGGDAGQAVRAAALHADDPIDSLEWHKKIKEDPTIKVVVAPSFRPDKALNIRKEGFADYIHKLEEVVGRKFACANCVVSALEERLEFFVEMGCRASDHGLDYIPFAETNAEKATAAFKKAMAGETLTKEEGDEYTTYLLLKLGALYKKHNVVMQMHYSCLRNVNDKMYRKLGPDTGFDMIAVTDCSATISSLLSALTKEDACPKVILYSLNPADFDMLGTILGAFQDDEIPGKIQLGSAWWFCDTDDGMYQQMKTLARLGLLGNFIGMLTDSRSFLSYTRHELFRRLMCNLIGNWVENGQYPNDEKALQKIVEGISYYNAKRYFNL